MNIKLLAARFYMHKIVMTFPKILRYGWAHRLMCKASIVRYEGGDYNG